MHLSPKFGVESGNGVEFFVQKKQYLNGENGLKWYVMLRKINLSGENGTIIMENSKIPKSCILRFVENPLVGEEQLFVIVCV